MHDRCEFFLLLDDLVKDGVCGDVVHRQSPLDRTNVQQTTAFSFGNGIKKLMFTVRDEGFRAFLKTVFHRGLEEHPHNSFYVLPQLVVGFNGALDICLIACNLLRIFFRWPFL